jgi:hypothetical protein
MVFAVDGLTGSSAPPAVFVTFVTVVPTVCVTGATGFDGAEPAAAGPPDDTPDPELGGAVDPPGAETAAPGRRDAGRLAERRRCEAARRVMTRGFAA